jgi:hypothetical protein
MTGTFFEFAIPERPTTQRLLSDLQDGRNQTVDRLPKTTPSLIIAEFLDEADGVGDILTGGRASRCGPR